MSSMITHLASIICHYFYLLNVLGLLPVRMRIGEADYCFVCVRPYACVLLMRNCFNLAGILEVLDFSTM